MNQKTENKNLIVITAKCAHCQDNILVEIPPKDILHSVFVCNKDECMTPVAEKIMQEVEEHAIKDMKRELEIAYKERPNSLTQHDLEIQNMLLHFS